MLIIFCPAIPSKTHLASFGNSYDYSRCLCIIDGTVSFIKIRRAAHTFERDCVAGATSLYEFRADADSSLVSGESGWKIPLDVVCSVRRCQVASIGVGSRHAAPSRNIAQQRTSSLRAKATTACFLRVF